MALSSRGLYVALIFDPPPSCPSDETLFLHVVLGSKYSTEDHMKDFFLLSWIFSFPPFMFYFRSILHFSHIFLAVVLGDVATKP